VRKIRTRLAGGAVVLEVEGMTTDLEQRQLALEEESIHAGIATYRNRTGRLEAKGHGGLTNYGKSLMQRTIEPMIGGIEKFKAEAETKPGRKTLAAQFLSLVDADVAAFITARCVFDGITNIQTYANLAIAIASQLENEVHFQSFEQQNKPLFNGVKRNLEKHPLGYQKVVRVSMLKHAAKKFEIKWSKWTHTDKLHLGSKLIDIFIESVGLVRLLRKKSFKDTTIYLEPTEELTQWIMDYKSKSELFCPMLLPMIAPPRDWTNPTDGGYYDGRLQRKLVKSRSKGYQKELRHREMPTVYRAVNALQATPWRVNAAMHTVVKEVWEAGLEVKGMPSRLDLPLPTKPTDFDTNNESRATWRKQAGDIFRHNQRAASKRMLTAKVLYVADKLSAEAAIYFPIQLDFRGRMYAMPLYLNPQGSDLAKSLLTFSEGKPLGPTGSYWLAVHIANTFGFDKCSLQERYEWTLKNSLRIVSMANDPLADRWWCEADKPFQFLAACIEWIGYVEQGGSYVCSLPIMVDGSCNGLQHFSAMLRDEVCGRQVNLTPTEKPSDIYAAVAEAVTRKLAESPDETAAQWLAYGITRKLCKRPVMILPYGGTIQAVKEYIADHVFEMKVEHSKPHPFSDKLMQAVTYLSSVMWQAMGEVVVGPRLAMDWLRQGARVVTKEGLSINWTTPSGFWVQQAYPDRSRRRVKTKIGDEIVYLTLVEDKVKLDGRKQAQALPPNFVHSLDAAALKLTICTAQDRGMTAFAAIHDSYGTIAADMQSLLDTLRECFVSMYQTDVLSVFRSEVGAVLPEGKEFPAVPAAGSLDLNGVLKSDFFFA
jgi:DNA-directed RNA polymerase